MKIVVENFSMALICIVLFLLGVLVGFNIRFEILAGLTGLAMAGGIYLKLSETENDWRDLIVFIYFVVVSATISGMWVGALVPKGFWVHVRTFFNPL